MIRDIPTEPRHTLWLLPAAVLISLVLGIAFQGSRGLFETTEGRYAEVARETMAASDIYEPVLNGHPHWTKPFLTYAAIMAGIKVFGLNPWGVRAFLVVAWMIMVASVGWAGSVIWNRRAGGLSALVAATSPFVATAANAVSTDMLLTAWVAVTMGSFFHCWYRRKSWALILTGAALGLGFLTKGPVALLVPTAIMAVAWPLCRWSTGWHPRPLAAVAGLFVFALVGMGWFLWEAWKHPGLMDYWLGQELATRFASDEFNRNPELLYALGVYLPIILFGTGPWLPISLLKSRPWRSFKFDVLGKHHVATGALLFGLIVPLLVFFISKSKLPFYITPLFVPLSILLGRAMDVLLSRSRLRWRTIASVTVGMVVIILFAKLTASFVNHANDMTRLSSHLNAYLAKQGEPVEIYSFGRRRLNGLQFHLQRPIVAVQAKDMVPHIMKRDGNKSRHIYLMKRKTWHTWKALLPKKPTITAVGTYWLAIEWTVNSA